MMKQLIPRNLGQGNKGHDRPAIQISRPIPIVAPRPVTSNIGQRLAENVLSIDDDEALPAGLRNLQDGPSGPSEDGLSIFDAAFLGQPEPPSCQNNEPRLHPDAPRGAHMARKTELRRPRLIARVDSTRRGPGNVPKYGPPKNIDFQEPLYSGARSPYPADTLTEMEYRGIIRAQRKLDSDADSRSITKPEHDMWESTKAKIGSTKEDVLARLGIKTKRVREAEKLGYTPLTRHAKTTIPSSGNPGGGLTEQRRKIEQWIRRASDEDDGVESPGSEAEQLRADADGYRANMTTAAGHAAACPGVRERWMHLKIRAFRSKPELRSKM